MVEDKQEEALEKIKQHEAQIKTLENMSEIRAEKDVFTELHELCTSPGYIHAISHLCFRDNIFRSEQGEITSEDILELYSHDRLIRTEISTLLGLLISQDVDFSIPSPETLQVYIDKTDELLKELHESINAPAHKIFMDILQTGKADNPFTKGEFLREAIFYSAESAYDFQYLDLFVQKYAQDNEWIKQNKGFEVQNISTIIKAITDIQLQKIHSFRETLLKTHPSKWSTLDIFTFSVKELEDKTHLSTDVITNVLEAFTAVDENKSFLELGDYNLINSHPLLKRDENIYILFQHYGLLEAAYESPFYWFLGDKTYLSKAEENRGNFTENFSAHTLSKIFGKENVYQNIDIYDNKKRVGEIDVLVVFANRAIVLQAKSKKLTLGARKGNDNLLADDFKKAIQDSYDQGNDCAKFIQDEKYKLIDFSGSEISIRNDYKEVYVFCVVSDHYPSLAFQSQQFLKYEETEIIKPPFVMDIFLLDVMSEMLQNPLYFMSYINKRTSYTGKLMAQSELTLLSYHLKRNLYLSDEFSMMMIDEDVTVDLDLALLVRKKGIAGKDTPEGILTKYKGTIIGNFLDHINNYEDDNAVELGFFLLTLSEEAIGQINEGTQKAINLFLKDGKNHDFTAGFDDASAGLTIHINKLPDDVAYEKLLEHCKYRKYIQKANNWFGLCIDPLTQQFRFGVMSNKEWVYSKAIGREVVEKIIKSKNKIGRNEKCPCGSGKKYKRCCLLQQ